MPVLIGAGFGKMQTCGGYPPIPPIFCDVKVLCHQQQGHTTFGIDICHHGQSFARDGVEAGRGLSASKIEG